MNIKKQNWYELFLFTVIFTLKETSKLLTTTTLVKAQKGAKRFEHCSFANKFQNKTFVSKVSTVTL